MDCFDLGLAWNWEYDADFVQIFDATCRQHGLSLLQITPGNLEPMLESLRSDGISFSSFFDRASEDDHRFMPVVEWARNRCAFRINPYERAHRTWDKAAMHPKISRLVPTPHTIILPPYNQKSDLPKIDLTPLGPTFTIKPAHGSGGEGVIGVATSIEQVPPARQEFPNDKYLLQAQVVPMQLGGRAAWFRVIYAAGEIYPNWWQTDSHIYAPVTDAEVDAYHLAPLRDLTQVIAYICKLDLFSTEIALTAEQEFRVVDYANDTIDLRLQSKTPEGVPDDVVRYVATSLAALVKRRRRRRLRGQPRCPRLSDREAVVQL
jgi:hypothetical protein